MRPWTLAWVALACASCTPPEYPLCRTDDQCRLGETCVDGRCVRCTDDASCGPGQSCEQGMCQADLDGCDDGADCNEGQVCLFSLCTSCFEDAQCGPGRLCVQGRCAGCGSDGDCSQGLACVDGACAQPEPPPAQDEVVGPEGCTLGPVFFDWDSDELTAAAKKALGAMLPCLDDGLTHAVIGRADDSGDEYYNLDLGLRRAEAVKGHLVFLGVPEELLVISSAGEKFATADAEKSRRVDIQ